ncbi:beta-lactamase family protein [Aestuariibacter sp. AA17]|uniref:Beta-lactamase family protein n=1 Tax=Fluctibacter corallii TaxID=2984329 RepID=A0ABT3AAN8_9ALTE|nr:serine hydrolase domain-containing protein [Aestuariibacter sp. AA17]MCV2885747.1 beta-lactamase family protein [Aestuariibacter sp. AA17]
MLNKNLITYIPLLLLAAISDSVYAAPHQHNLCATEDISTAIKSTIASIQKDYDLPSFSLALGLNNDLLFADAIGYANIQKKIPATPTTRYSVGSVAKPMTGIALATLLDDDVMQLDAPIASYLPNYPEHAHAVTFKQLASHTSGIGRPWDIRQTLEFDKPRDFSTPMDVLPFFKDEPLWFSPGSDFQYTSMGYVLLSAAMEAAAKQPYMEIMQASWTQLGMHNTALDDSIHSNEKEATYYTKKDDKGHFVPAITPRDRSFLFGGGGFISTPSDLIKLTRALSTDTLLSKNAVKQVTTPVTLNNGEVNKQFYGLGWRIQTSKTFSINGKPVNIVHHGGVMGGASTAFVLLMPDYDASVAYATNHVPENHGKMRSEVGKLLARIVEKQHKSCTDITANAKL